MIEDDYDTEYRYVDRPIEPLQRLDPERVVYVGSFSKTISPSLRLGFIVCPPELADALLGTRADVDTQPPHLTQAALAAFITSGELDRHLRRTRRTYRARRQHLLGRLAELVADGSIVDHDPCLAGLHVTVRLPDDVAIPPLVERLNRHGVAVNMTSLAWLGEAGPLLELGFGLADESELDTGLDELATLCGGMTLPLSARLRLREGRRYPGRLTGHHDPTRRSQPWGCTARRCCPASSTRRAA